MGRVRLNFSSGPVNIPIMGQVKPGISVTPARIVIPASGEKPMERLVMLRGAEPFEITGTKLDSAEGKVLAEKISTTQWRVKITVAPSTIQPGARLEIKTSLKFTPVVNVPLGSR